MNADTVNKKLSASRWNTASWPLVRWRAAMAALLLGLVLLPLLLPPAAGDLAIDVGAEPGLNGFGESPDGFYLFDMHPAEQDADGQTSRWTMGFSTLRMLNIFGGNSPLLVELRACGCRPEGLPGAEATLEVNGWGPLPLPLGPQFRSYRLLVPHRPSDYGRDLYLAFSSSAFSLPGDNRTLGLRLDALSATPLGRWSSLGLSPLVAWLLYVVALGLFWQLNRRSRSASYGVVLLAIALLTLPYLYRPHIFPPLALGTLSAVAVYSGWLVGSWRGRDVSGGLDWHAPLLAGTGLWMVWSTQVLGHWMLDDAYISFRYSDNLLAGHGLVFNPGERVEGYTNFLWTLIMAVPLAWGQDPTLPSALLTLLCGLATMLLTYEWGMQRAKNQRQAVQPSAAASQQLAAVFPALFLALSGPFLLYSARGSGMETALFTLLLTAGSFAVQRANTTGGYFVAGLLLALATMTRPDGVLAVAAAGLYLLFKSVAGNLQNIHKSLLGTPVFLTLGFLALFGPYYIWRYTYYGYPLPNTFYAKVGSGWAQTERGLAYTGEFAAAIGWPFVSLLLLAALAMGTVGGRKRQLKKGEWDEIGHLALLLALYSGYIIYVGGDHFPGYRFFVPLLPTLALLLQAALATLMGAAAGSRLNVRSLAAAVAGIGYLLFTAAQLPASDSRLAGSPVRGEHNVVEKNRELGLWLRDNAPPGTLVATGIAGALPFYSRLPVVDTLGLNDLHIAHPDVADMGAGIAGAEKTDLPYVLDRQPYYIPFSTSGPFQKEPRFQREYKLIEVRGPEGRAIKLYRRGSR